METDTSSHMTQIDYTAEQREAWAKQYAGLQSVIQAYGSYPMYVPPPQGAYQPPQPPHAYYGTAGMIVVIIVFSLFF